MNATIIIPTGTFISEDDPRNQKFLENALPLISRVSNSGLDRTIWNSSIINFYSNH